MNISQQAQKLNKKQLVSIDLKDIFEIEEKRLNDGELKERAGNAYGFYKSYFEDVIKLLIQEQLEFLGKTAETQEQLLFARGTINGLYIIQDWFNEQSNIAKSPLQDKRNEEDDINKITEE